MESGLGPLSRPRPDLDREVFDASFSHMYAPGTRQQIGATLAAGATMREVMAALARMEMDAADDP